MPSVFGKNNLKFAEKDNVYIENNENYFLKIVNEISSKLS